MSIDTVKLLYNDINSTRFTAQQYTNFEALATRYIYTKRPDLFATSVVLPVIQFNNYACVETDQSLHGQLLRFYGLTTSSTGTGTDAVNKLPRLVEFSEAIAKDPTWGRTTSENIQDITEYVVDYTNCTNTPQLMFNTYVPSVYAQCTYATLTDTATLPAWASDIRDKYMLYLCYSADSTSQQDQAIAVRYLQEVDAALAQQQPLFMQQVSPHGMAPLSKQFNVQPAGRE